ncbi:MAG: DUF3320 domain-containing protein, partial [Armatimonadetes bacterium]|nr:DUF3320 domain-containing protein [Armatimonadota bacterium]
VRQLNAHSEAINTPIENSELCLHQIYGLWLQNERAIEVKKLNIPTVSEANLAQKTATEITQLRALIAQTQDAVARSGPLQNHPFSRSNIRVLLPTDVRALRDNLRLGQSLLGQISAQSQTLAIALKQAAPSQNIELKPLIEAAATWRNAPDLAGVDLINVAWSGSKAEIGALFESGESLRDLKRDWEARLRPAAWMSNVSATRIALEMHGRKWFRFLLGPWRAAQKELALLTTEPPPKPLQEQLEILAIITRFQQSRATFAAYRALGQTLFGSQWRDLTSDFSALRTVRDWLEGVQQKQRAGALSGSFLQSDARENPALDTRPLLESLTQLKTVLEAIQRDLAWPDPLPTNWDMLTKQLEHWEKNLDRLGEVTAFNGFSARLREAGLKQIDSLARSWEQAPQGLTAAFERAHLESLLRAGMTLFPHLNAFDGPSHEKLAADFSNRDRAHLQHTSHAIALRHFEAIQDCREGAEIKILRREWEKQRAHLAPRRLISKIRGTLQALKPVMMMSPLSVATYLPANDLKFDLVIFDEASQVRPTEAFGALLRGKQAVVAGDSKQLPPTSFFDKFLSDEEEDADSNNDNDFNTKDLESILGLFIAQGAPERMLRWHYRSRHESLIAVSNREFYDDKLVVFPSPDAARSNMGLVCHVLPHTVYGGSINRGEAKAVAEAVMEHARNWIKTPAAMRRTLGVAAFSVKQAQEIQDQLEVLRRQNEEFEAFFALDIPEPFFVKNLENVQGDERDVMFLSIGYGRDEFGKVAMRFGPLGNSGGERRLNVLISRARLRCEVFTNMRADDVDLNRTNSLGVRALKQFLAYAQTGNFAASIPSGREMDSPFEAEVLRAIESLGYNAVPQIGSAGYFIDLAVQDPKMPGRYVLGVECDGASYHSAASARDRDRLRAQVLENMGWKLHRIWSTDWFQRRTAETRRLQQAIEKAINE